MVAIALYVVTIPGTFAYDFYGLVRNDMHLLNPHEWDIYWQQSYNGGVDNLYRPLTSTLFAVQAYLFGIDGSHAWRFHVISVLLHAGVSALVAELARRLTNSRVALISGLIYAAHPIHVEVIGDIVGQAEMFCALGTLGALVLFLHRPMTNLRAVAILLLFALAVLTKEQGMLLPLLLVCLALCLRLRSPAIAAQSRALHVEPPDEPLEYASLPVTHRETRHTNAMKLLVLLLCWSLGAYVFFRERIVKFWWDRYFLDPAINPMKLSVGIDRWLMPLVLLGRYTTLLVFPWKLAPDYSGTAIGWQVRFDDPYLYAGIIALLLWFILATLALVRRNGVMLFCLLGVAITYGLIGNIVTIIGTNFAERLMYLPSVFFVILVAMGLARLRKTSLIAVMAVILIAASVRTFTYAKRWNDRLALYEHAVKDEPGAVRMYMALAYEYYERGDNDDAIATAAKAREVMPNYARIWVFSAALAIKTGQLDDAERFLNRANSIEPSPAALALMQELETKRPATRPTQ